jgi:ornithine--oxo-acid transaminase
MTIIDIESIDQAPASTPAAIALVEQHSAHNYHPLPVVISEGEGAWVTDVEGRRYLDMLAAYSALNFGHRHPRLIRAAQEQLGRLTLTSRAFHTDQFGPFCAELAALCGKDMVLPMNTGAEAVETALKTARKWGYRVKGVPDGQATVVVCGGNFHGRTIGIISFSDDPVARNDYGPYLPGYRLVPFGDAAAVAEAIDDTTVAVLVEPIQGEGGVIVPPDDFLPAIRRLCTQHNVLMIADEVQTGLGRTGRTFACEAYGVVPDIYVLGKALGGGVVPVSAVVADEPVLGVFRPGEHGSTFGGNPLACAVGREVVRMLSTGEFQDRARQLGEILHAELRRLPPAKVAQVRGVGVWAGVELVSGFAAREVCEGMMRRGILVKETHETTIRLAPPIVIEESDLRWALDQLSQELG